MTNRHKNTVGRRPRIVVGGQPVEPTVHAHVPRITHPPRIEFEVVATNEVDGIFWGTPSAAEGSLLLRSADALICVRAKD